MTPQEVEADPFSRIEPTTAHCPWAGLVSEVARVAARQRWGLALMATGWLHLVAFAACQKLYRPEILSDPQHALIWLGEFVGVVAIWRGVAGPFWWRATPLTGVIARVWMTFAILAFNAATWNTLTGWNLDWFKLSWCGLSSFGFATMAWLLGPRWLIPAVGMSLTGLLMTRWPFWHYAIYGISWWATLQGMGIMLERHRMSITLAGIKPPRPGPSR